MVHAYHLIMPMYGFWLPNDPRGSWSDYIRKWELLQFGSASRSIERRDVTELSEQERLQRDAAKRSLTYPAVSIDGHQAAAIAAGFATKSLKSNYTIWACSILPEHTHLVIARHSYPIEQVANLLKGAATHQLITLGIHPLLNFAKLGKRPPRMWTSRQWKVFLDCETAIDEAIRYVEDNPVKEGKPKQNWSFVKPFEGIPTGGWITYY